LRILAWIKIQEYQHQFEFMFRSQPVEHELVRRSTRHLCPGRFWFLGFSIACVHAERGGRQRLVVGLGPGDLRAHRVVPKSGGRGDNPAAKHYQIAFEFERRGVTGEDGRAGQLECGLWRQRGAPASRIATSAGERGRPEARLARDPRGHVAVCAGCRAWAHGPWPVRCSCSVLPLGHWWVVTPPPRHGTIHTPSVGWTAERAWPETCSTSTPHALDRSGSDEF